MMPLLSWVVQGGAGGAFMGLLGSEHLKGVSHLAPLTDRFPAGLTCLSDPCLRRSETSSQGLPEGFCPDWWPENSGSSYTISCQCWKRSRKPTWACLGSASGLLKAMSVGL